MGILDTIKGLFTGRERQIKGGIDKVSDTLEHNVPGQAQRIDDLSDKAKGAVDKLGAGPATEPPGTASTPPTTSTTSTASDAASSPSRPTPTAPSSAPPTSGPTPPSSTGPSSTASVTPPESTPPA